MALGGRCLSRRERAIVAALADTMAAPEPPLPPVHETDAVDAIDAWLSRAPALNRAALRGALWLVGARGFAARDRPARTRALRQLERTPLRQLIRVLTGMVVIAYYGDDGASRALGYDPDAVLRRAA